MSTTNKQHAQVSNKPIVIYINKLILKGEMKIMAIAIKGKGNILINGNVSFNSLKDQMINKLKEHNQECIDAGMIGEVVTRLYYKDENKECYVEDYSPFANINHMSTDLLVALRTGQTLTSELQRELGTFKIESYSDATVGTEKYFLDKSKLAILHENEHVLNKRDTERLLKAAELIKKLGELKSQNTNKESNTTDSKETHPITININIEKVDSEKSAKQLFEAIEKGFKDRGLKF